MKTTTKKATKAKKNAVEMVSYSIEMTIPTGAYANIKPSIVVKGGSIQEAHDFIAPHMNKLWKEYYLVNERRPEPPVSFGSNGTVSPLPSNITTAKMTTEQIITATGGKEICPEELPKTVAPAVQPPDSGVALIKATQAIEACMSLEALELIEAQVIKSVKLSKEDKESLMPLLHQKAVDLTFPEDEKKGN